jgi:hypothetical protein
VTDRPTDRPTAAAAVDAIQATANAFSHAAAAADAAAAHADTAAGAVYATAAAILLRDARVLLSDAAAALQDGTAWSTGYLVTRTASVTGHAVQTARVFASHGHVGRAVDGTAARLVTLGATAAEHRSDRPTNRTAAVGFACTLASAAARALRHSCDATATAAHAMEDTATARRGDLISYAADALDMVAVTALRVVATDMDAALFSATRAAAAARTASTVARWWQERDARAERA